MACSLRSIGILDLDYTQNAHCKLIGSAKLDKGLEFHTRVVNATSDGMGLIILTLCRYAHTVICQCLTCLPVLTKFVVVEIAMFIKYIREAQHLSSPELSALIFILLATLYSIYCQAE